MKTFLSLLVFLWQVIAEVPTEEERIAILEYHTKLRESVEPSASNMQLMTYSTEMEKLAEVFTSNNLNVSSLPQDENIGYLDDNASLEKPKYADLLANVNGNKYNYYRDECEDTCWNYKQMVWAASTQVGCAINAYRGVENKNVLHYTIACVYKSSDIELRGRPYNRGQSCSECPENFVCHRKQCADVRLPAITLLSTVTELNDTTMPIKTTSMSTVLSTLAVLQFTVLLLNSLR
uniref:SCP domain-containing protein n=1 Tax=Mesocestoides corti TaxID=53468 RepID=A0A5K3ENV2_MESCO